MPTQDQQAVIDERDALGLQIVSAEAALPALIEAAGTEAEAVQLASDHEALRRQFYALNAQIKEFG